MPAVPKVSCYSKGRSACVVQSLEIHSSVPAPLGSRPGLAPTYVLTHMSWCRISPVMVGKKALVVDLRGVDGDAGPWRDVERARLRLVKGRRWLGKRILRPPSGICVRLRMLVAGLGCFL
jgi:hypothetical protein